MLVRLVFGQRLAISAMVSGTSMDSSAVKTSQRDLVRRRSAWRKMSRNAAFTELVDAVVAHGKKPLLCDEDIRHQVQQRCAVAEGELEQYWSRRITKAGNPWSELKEFPYHENYKELTRCEIGLLERAGLWLCDSSEVAMIGSGAGW